MELWIARDKNGQLNLYTYEPFKGPEDRFYKSLPNAVYMPINPYLYPEITWENSPKKVKAEVIA